MASAFLNYCGVEQSGSSSGSVDPKLTSRSDVLSAWAARAGNGRVTPVKFGGAFTGNTEPSSNASQLEALGKV